MTKSLISLLPLLININNVIAQIYCGHKIPLFGFHLSQQQKLIGLERSVLQSSTALFEFISTFANYMERQSLIYTRWHLFAAATEGSA
jgi:hypothetical protein